MPNYCNYSMCVVGAKENVEEFIKVINSNYDYNKMEFDYDRHMFRVFEAICDEIEERYNGTYQAIINGYCAWSVASCMLEHGYYQDCKASFGDNFRGTTLLLESERLGLDIEVFSEESGMCFQEHYIIRKGNLTTDECVDWCEHYLGDYETKEEAEEDLGMQLTDEEWENYSDDYISRGGFGDWEFEI